jgi:DegV family protein with EDD domain
MASVAVVTDSTSDLDAALRERYGIDVVPLFVNFGSQSLRDGVELSRDAFYARLATSPELPTTTQPTPAMFADAFRPHVEAGRTIVCLTIMSRLSGTVNAATAAATEFPGAPIHVIDSESVSGGLALQAIHAAELAAAGSDAGAILTSLERDRAAVRGFATLPDLSHAVRTGRISRAQAFIGSLIKIVPVLRIERGAIETEAQVRRFERAQDVMIAAALRAAGAGGRARLCIMHSRALDLALAIEERLRGSSAAFGELHVVEAGPVIATHAGSGAVGVFVLPE